MDPKHIYYLEITTDSNTLEYFQINSDTELDEDDILEFGYDIPYATKGKIISEKPEQIHIVIECRDFPITE